MGGYGEEKVLITQGFSGSEQQGKGRSVWAALFRFGGGALQAKLVTLYSALR
jgi:hypothetical protein